MRLSQRWKARAVIFMTGAAVGTVAFGLWSATNSPLFTLRIIEVVDLPDQAPVDAQTIQALITGPTADESPIGRMSLFRLDLLDIERRVLSNPWIRDVRIKKRFPQTLTVSVDFREPKAMLQQPDGAMTYVDASGLAFGRVNPSLPASTHLDLPVLITNKGGLTADQPDRIVEALQFVDAWSQSTVSASAQIASMAFDTERGFRAMITYPVSGRQSPHGARIHATRVRAYIELGQEIDADRSDQLRRLDDVVRYLSSQGISARQIWADSGKKIVVKIARGS